MFSGLFKSQPTKPRVAPRAASATPVAHKQHGKQLKDAEKRFNEILGGGKEQAQNLSGKNKKKKKNKQNAISREGIASVSVPVEASQNSSSHTSSSKKRNKKQKRHVEECAQSEPLDSLEKHVDKGFVDKQPNLPSKKSKKNKKRSGNREDAGLSENFEAAKKRPRSEEEQPKQGLFGLSNGKSSSSIQKAKDKLRGSRFRWLNEQLYTIPGHEAFKMYQDDPSLSEAYHDGYRLQRAEWPADPLEDIIKWAKKEVPQDHVIGDFGCGEARLAASLPGQKVHSFDLVRVNERVTPCNIANVPLPKQSINVAVFCLALMGTDWPKFVKEARRCLKPGGVLYVAEVASRFTESIEDVAKEIESIGFRRQACEPHGPSSGFFVIMQFVAIEGRGADKGKKSENKLHGAKLLQACTYKRR